MNNNLQRQVAYSFTLVHNSSQFILEFMTHENTGLQKVEQAVKSISTFFQANNIAWRKIFKLSIIHLF